MAEPCTGSLREAVGRLQSRLLQSPSPPKLLKLLKKLADLPITLDILSATRVGKTVNALRRYERVALLARALVAQWKKLVPVFATATQNKGSGQPGPERRLSRKRTRDLSNESNVEGRDVECDKASCSLPLRSWESRKKKCRKLDENMEASAWGESRGRGKSRGEDDQGKGEKEERGAGKGQTRRKGETKAIEESRENGETGQGRRRGKGKTQQDTQVEKKEEKGRNGKGSGNQLSLLHSSNCELASRPQASINPQQVSMDNYKAQEKKVYLLRPPQKSQKRPSQVIQDKEGDNPKRRLVKPEVKMAVHFHHHQNKGHKSLEGKKAPLRNKGNGKHFELSQEELGRVVSRAEGSNPSSKTSPKEKQVTASALKIEEKTESSSGKENTGPPSEVAPQKSIHKPKEKNVQRTKVEKSKLSVDSLHGETLKGELTPEVQEEVKIQKRREALNANEMPSKNQGSQESDKVDGFERHPMSFESYLLYDQPKKRRVGKTPSSGSRKEGHSKLKSGKPETESHSAVKMLPMDNSRLPKKNQAGTGSANPPKSSDGSPALPALQLWSGSSSGKDICHNPLSVKATSYPLSSGELNPAFWLKKQVSSTPQENRVDGLNLSRVNSKTKVCSGTKNSYIPKMLSLYEQCIRVLGKKIDLIYEVGQVPYHVLTPVLEQCSPEQLYRIEEYNPIFLEDSDTLWKVHCSREFKKEQPEEFESWREMYLRLHDAQEQRLRHLTNSIRLAHAKRQKGRRTKMLLISPMSRSPYDVPGRQILRLGGTEVLKNSSVEAIEHTLSSKNSPYRDDSHGQDKEPSDGPSTSSVHLAPSGSNEDSKTTPGKKVAPMMANSIKIFKNKLVRL